MNELTDLTLRQASDLVHNRSVSSIELTDATLKRIEATEPLIHAFASLRPDEARLEAGEADAELRRGMWRGPLHGIPMGVKDLLYTKDLPTEAGSRVLAGFRPTYDATVVTKLRQSGAILIGKTVTHEFALGQNLPETRNPWRLDCYPGGSSAGSATAVAARSLFGSIGTDTGGSVRTPAAVNGIVGLRPTYGRVSRHGVIPLSTSLDQVGPLARTVEDCALILQAIAGFDPHDPGSVSVPVSNYEVGQNPSIAGIRVGIDAGYFMYHQVSSPVRAAVDAAIGKLTEMGAIRVDVRVPELEWCSVVGIVTTLVEASSWHRGFLRSRLREYHPGTRLMLELGELIPASHYLLVQRARKLIRDGMRRTFAANGLDVMIGPTIPITAPPIEQLSVSRLDDSKPGALSTLTHHGYPASVTGLPAISVPCGFSDQSLPIGFQLIGRPFDEATILRIASAYEAVTSWHTRKPDLSRPISSGS
jgi:Asp-tRNA(Asn)/Glu-tRNA(Gln) amidotransferase A subunit family amidase